MHLKLTQNLFARMGLQLVLLISAGNALAGFETSEAEAVADNLHAALVAGDEEGVRNCLAASVLVFESGGVESSLEEYASHHMHADMEFMQGIEREILSRDTWADGDQAVVSTRSRLSGTYKQRPVSLNSTETLVIRQTADGPRIVHIHWSSSPAN